MLKQDYVPFSNTSKNCMNQDISAVSVYIPARQKKRPLGRLVCIKTRITCQKICNSGRGLGGNTVPWCLFNQAVFGRGDSRLLNKNIVDNEVRR